MIARGSIFNWTCRFCGEVFDDFYEYKEHELKCVPRRAYFMEIYQRSTKVNRTFDSTKLSDFYDMGDVE